MGKCGPATLVIFTILGALLMGAGLAMIYVFRSEIKKQINENLPLRNGSSSFKTWKDPPAPVYMQFWMFDLQNVENVTKFGAKPIVKEKGPYTYKEIRPKENVEFVEDGTQLTYMQPKYYEFQRNMSVGAEDTDTIMTVNLPLIVLGTKMQYKLGLIQTILKELLETLGERLFERHTVKEYLWGYHESSIDRINNFTQKWFSHKFFKNDMFGLFYGPNGNGTNDGMYQIFTGIDDISKFNVINKWRNESDLNFWSTRYCNMINGTDGSMWHSYVNKEEMLYLFSSDICRSIHLKYEKETSYRGINLYNFVPPANVFANHSVNPDNAGFCTPDCLGSGVLNVSNCKAGVPIIMSQPHFFQGAQKYIEAIEGMHPNLEHQTSIDIEPYTGAAMRVAKKLQINMHIKQLESLNDTIHFNSTVFPLVWLNESARITSEGADDFMRKVMQPIHLLDSIKYALIGVGGLIFACCLIVTIVLAVKLQRRKADTLLVNSDDGVYQGD